MGDDIHPIVRWNVENLAIFLPQTCHTIWKREDSIKKLLKENFNSCPLFNLSDRSVNVSLFFSNTENVELCWKTSMFDNGCNC